MKFKTQESESPKNNSFLDSIIDLIVVNKQFSYAIKNYPSDNSLEYTLTKQGIGLDCQNLLKLAVALNPEHKYPTMTVEYVPIDDVKDLVKLEEKYYNMLKEIANNALEVNNAEVFSYLSPMIKEFNHYFCKLDESNNKGEISS